MKIAGKILDESDIALLEQLGRSGYSRTQIAERICERKQLVDDLGRLRVIAARIDIGRAANAGALRLPPSALSPLVRKRRSTPAGPPQVPALPSRKLEDLGSLDVRCVQGAEDPQSALWNECLQKHHYLGSGPLCGAQLRYLVFSRQEIVAALSFSAAARHVAARDEFIGWSREAMVKHRKFVVQQSRLCFTLQVKNLASYVQSRVLAQLPDDWEDAYGYRPVLVETYVDLERFNGASYRASNWHYVGRTSGRGRQDQDQMAEASVKAIYVYPLGVSWKARLCREPIRENDPEADWAETEWGGADLGDRRRNERLVTLGRSCFERPTASTPQACDNRASLKAAYRLLNHPSATMEAFLRTHREASLARAKECDRVFVIEDTTSLNYTGHPATTGLGPITSTGARATKGLQLHTSMLATPTGLALGILDAACWSRDPESFGSKHRRKHRPIAEKESNKWLRGYEAANEAAERLEKTEVVVICDREADMYELFHAAAAGRARVLVRAAHPRSIVTVEGEQEGNLWECLAEERVKKTVAIPIARSGTRPAREAIVDLRCREVRLAAPPRMTKGVAWNRRYVTAWAISATERGESCGEHEPIEWRLLTTCKTTSGDEAHEKIEWYTKRWLIEVFHRTLKSGLQVERRQSRTAETLQAALAIDMVVAWRILYLTQLGREVPQMPASAIFEDAEWKALYGFMNRTCEFPSKAPPLGEFTRWVAKLGGFLGRKCDGAPGAEVLWRGLERLTDITAAYRAFVLRE